MYVILPHVKSVEVHVHVSVHAFGKMNTLYMNYSAVYFILWIISLMKSENTCNVQEDVIFVYL